MTSYKMSVFLGLSLAEAREIIQSLKEKMGDRLPEIFKI